MKHPTMLAKIVTSHHEPELLSIRAHAQGGAGGTFKRALVTAGFEPGDVIELRLVKREEREPCGWSR